MKHFRRFLSMCMAVVILCGAAVGVSADHPFPTELYPGEPGTRGFYGTTETGIYGTSTRRFPYPVTYNYYKEALHTNTNFNMRYEELQRMSAEQKLNYLASLWFSTYRITSPETWCEEYLAIYEKRLANHETIMSPLDAEKPKYRVSDYTWDGRALTVQCEGDYNITYTTEKVLNLDINQYVETSVPVGKFRVRAAIALTSKTDGSLEYLVQHSSFVMEPSTTYSGTDTGTLKAVLPEIYDPLKHNVTLYFYGDDNYYFHVYTEESYYSRFYNPCDITAPVPTIPGDVDGDGEIDAVDTATFSRWLVGASVDIADGVDVNGDGDVTVADLSLLRRELSGTSEE